jgi:hypothetical protein
MSFEARAMSAPLSASKGLSGQVDTGWPPGEPSNKNAGAPPDLPVHDARAIPVLFSRVFRDGADAHGPKD